MIAVDPAEFIRVPEGEFARHLGYPDALIPGGRSREVAAAAEQWFVRHARPWYASRVVRIEHVNNATVRLETGTVFESEVVAERLRGSQCHSVLLLAVSTGSEVEAEITSAWKDERPDESYALNSYAAAATEQLLSASGKVLCTRAEETGDTLLQHYSPGYTGWDIGDQALVMSLLKSRHGDLALDLLESGLLTPQKSMLAVLGVTSRPDLVTPDLVACTTCAQEGCQLRRLPYAGPPVSEAPQPEEPAPANPAESSPPPPRSSGYAFPLKALKRWRSRFLELEDGSGDGSRLHARFIYHGSTCSDGGIPLTFLYDVWLERGDDGLMIRDMSCRPQEDDDGHKETCSYQINARNALSHYESFKPLLGSPISAAVSWNPTRNPAGCLCNAGHRNHKWMMALQTIHYALHADHE